MHDAEIFSTKNTASSLKILSATQLMIHNNDKEKLFREVKK